MNKYSTVALNTGRQMPILGLGTWQLTINTPATVEAALRLGYRMIDTSGDYGTQPGIAEGIERSGVERAGIYLITKVEESDNAYEATRRNLGELRQEYADLILIHRPPEVGAGEELWDGLVQARKEGLTRDVGVSNYSIELIEELIDKTGEVPVVNQIEWSPFGYSEDMLAYAKENNIIIQAYSPLTREKRLGNDVLEAIAESHRKTPAQILIRWNLELGVVPIPKANQKKHLEENINVFDFELSDGDIDALNSLNEHYSSLGRLQYVR